jgi:8-oxo-dGTP pyrophosphatase MutT (NUDIX family)
MPVDAGLKRPEQIEQVRVLLYRQLYRGADYEFFSMDKVKHDGQIYREIVKGKVEENESLPHALFRELEEETGLFESQVRVRNWRPIVLRYLAEREGKEVFTTSYVIAANLLDPHARIVVGRFENHINPGWAPYANTALQLRNPRYPEQYAGFVLRSQEDHLIPKKSVASLDALVLRPTMAEATSYGKH